jgi:hypothetical protein
MCAAALFLGALAPANAQATRTWVSGFGDDANPCSRTAPCKTFAGAISKTAAAGEIDCIDPGGFGAVTITKSITLDCTGTFGSVLASGTNGIVINAAATDLVTIRGIDVEGLGLSFDGIKVFQAGAVHVEKCTIRGFRAGTANGINFMPSNAGAKLFVTDSRITDNGTSGVTAGIQVRPTGAGSANVVIDNVKVEANTFGIFFDGSGSSGGIRATIRGGMSSGNSVNGIGVSSNGTSVNVFADNVVLANNGVAGFATGGAGAAGFLSNAVVSGNSGAAISFGAPATLVSISNNNIAGNPGGDGAFSSSITTK